MGIGLVANRVILQANDRMCEMVGYCREELIGKNARMLYATEEDYEYVGREKYRQIREHGTGTVETRLRRKDGQIINILLSSTPLDREDISKGVTFSALDITARKHAEQELQNIFDLSLDLVCITDINTGSFVKVNPAFEDTLGYKPADLVGTSFLDFVHPNDVQATVGIVETKLRKGQSVVSFENRYRTKDGSYRWLSWTSHPDPEQGLTYAIAHDVTERRQTEATLRERETILNKTGTLAQIGGWKHDLATGQATWTQALYDIIEIECGPPPGVDEHLSYYPEEDRRVLEEAYGRAVEGGEPFDLELRARTAKGRPLWCRVIGRPVMRNGACVEMRGTFQEITERKRVETALRESEARFRELAKMLPQTVFEVDPDGRFTFCNHAGLEALGYTLEELLRLDVRQLFVPEDRERVSESIRRRLANEAADDREYRGLRKDGSTFPALIYASPIVRDGRTVGLRGIGLDITERKEAEKGLEMFRFSTDQAPDAVFWMERDGGFRYVNDRACESLGYSREELMRLKLWDIDPYFPKERLEEEWAQYRRDEMGTQHLESWHRRKDGTEFPIDVSSRHFWFGETEFHVAYVRDVTERQRAESAIQESKTKLEGILESSPYAFAVTNLKGIVEDCSQATLQMHGLASKAEFLGRSVLQFVAEDDHPKTQMLLEKLLRQKLVRHAEIRLRRKDGSQFPCEVGGSVMDDRSGNPIGLVLMAADITERRRTQEALRRSEEKYRSLIANIPDVVWTSDQYGTTTFMSRNVEDVCGYGPEEICGQQGHPWFDRTHPDDIAAVREAETRLFEEGTPLDIEYRFKRKDGRWVWLQDRSTGTYEKDGVRYADGVFVDVTERREAEEALRASLQSSSDIVASIPSGLLIYRYEPPETLRLASGNPAAGQLSNRDIAQHIGQTFDEIWPATRGTGLRDRCLQVMKTGQTYQTEEFFYEDDRLTGIFSIRAFRIPEDRLCVAFENVTEGRRAERALHESQRKLSTLMANLPGMAYRCLDDEQWTMEFASEGCFELTGYKSEDVVGNQTISYNEIIHRGDRERVHEEIERALAAGHAFELEYRIVTCKGEEKWVWERGRLVSGSEGDVHVLEGFILDISERQEAAERLRAHQKKLRLLASELALAEERERRRIAADLHDHACQSLALSKMKLQNVLDATEPIDPETLRDVCRTLNQTLESVRDLTFDLSSPTLYKFGLEAALEELLRDKLKGEHNIRYRFSDDEQPKPLPDDVLILLFQSVRELLINVIKHAGAREVTLDIRRQNGCIEIVLTDDGVGFDVGDVLSPPSQRRGVGLFNIVERLEYIGGKLNMDSHPGHGSRFSLIAPLQTEAHAAKEPRNGSENPTR